MKKIKNSKSEEDIKILSSISETELYAPTSSEKARENYNKGIDSLKKKDLESAINYFKMAISIDPNYVDAYDNLGLVYRQQGNLENAEYHYKKSVEIYPQGYTAHQNLAVVYDLKKEFDNAVKEYEIMKKIDHHNPEGYYGLANLYIHNRKFESALIEAKKGLELYLESNHPYKKDAQFQMGIIYYYMNEKVKAREFFKIAKANGAEIPEVIALEFNL